MNQEIKNKM